MGYREEREHVALLGDINRVFNTGITGDRNALESVGSGTANDNAQCDCVTSALELVLGP